VTDEHGQRCLVRFVLSLLFLRGHAPRDESAAESSDEVTYWAGGIPLTAQAMRPVAFGSDRRSSVAAEPAHRRAGVWFR
jgi:hypothetical protein